MAGLTLTMMLSYAFPFLLPLVKTGFLLFLIICVIDIVLLFNKRVDVSIQRETAPVLSLGDDNPVQLMIFNKSGLKLRVTAIDELPQQFQIRNLSFQFTLPAFSQQQHKYFLLVKYTLISTPFSAS
jgi:hypothetical protein